MTRSVKPPRRPPACAFPGAGIDQPTFDGLDLAHLQPPTEVEVIRSQVEGNDGDQIKITSNALITESGIICDCGYFDGKPFTFNVDHRRAGYRGRNQ